ncbi:Sensor histidine kinase RcsC [Candidatus Magnetaquicoccaceae bacterium FCR-1]|uniref:histidine kinase n=1 Tax=Candidatus Magnetaquiglobus chichijimensis TaxID=3141448 RepID=A0ABQ0C7M4_9PROT
MAATDPQVHHLRERLQKLAEEKSNLQLILSLIERLTTGFNPRDMVQQMLTSVIEIIGGTDMTIHYWIGNELHLASFLGEERVVGSIDDPLSAQVAMRREFIEHACGQVDPMLHDGITPGPWHWAFPLLVGTELIGVVKIENIQINSSTLRRHLPIFFTHLALTLGNCIREHIRRDAEAALRKKTEELDRYFINSLDLLCIADMQGTFRKLNPAWRETLGYPLIELEGRRVLDFVHPDDMAATLEAIGTLTLRLPVINFVNRFLHKNGGSRWIEWHARAVDDLIYAVARDITARKELEQSLLAQQRQYEELTSRIPVGVYKFRIHADGSMGFDYVSDRFCQLTSQSREAILNNFNAAFDPIHPEDITDFIAANREAGRALKPFRWEGRFLIHGQVRWVLIESTGQRESNGDSIWDGVIADVTERHLFEAELRHAKEAAEAGNRAKGEFLAAMSHEIRTPMNVVLGMAELLLDTELTDKQHHYAQTMHHSGRALLGVINDILDFSRIEAGRLQLVDEIFSPALLVEETVQLMRLSAEEKGLTMHASISPAIPEAMLGDDGRLRQVLINLLGNAIKFTARGRVEVNLTVHPEERDMLLFSVSDTGIGVPTEQLEHIFEQFTQADFGITRRYGGTGLGLAISRHLVGMMGGWIRVQSQPGVGSTFHFTMPMRLAQTSLHPTVPPSDPCPIVTPVAGLDILLAEDVEENRMLFEAYLLGTPHRLVQAVDGIEAVDRFVGGRFDVVVMDVQMPRMDGYTATRRIRQWEKEHDRVPVPIITLSAHALEGELERCRVAGANVYLTKPISKKKLLSELQKLCERKQTQDANTGEG